MKKVLILMLVLALLLSGCAGKKKITVDFQNHTISDGTHTYEYTDTRKGDVRTIVICYPDGGAYTWTQDSFYGSGNMEHGFSMERYTNGDDLLQAVLAPEKEETPEEKGFLWLLALAGILVAALGLLQVLYPVKVWDLFMRWYYQEDPGEYALTRIISRGIGLIILGAGVILVAIFA